MKNTVVHVGSEEEKSKLKKWGRILSYMLELFPLSLSLLIRVPSFSSPYPSSGEPRMRLFNKQTVFSFLPCLSWKNMHAAAL